MTNFFGVGKVLPTHRLWHSPYGGPYQSTMEQAIKLLSGPPEASDANPNASTTPTPLTYSTDGQDEHLAPASYSANRNSWVHVFPEACCHQNQESTLRYFKWGVSRMILESEPAPDFVPMFIHGTQNVMPDDRGWPRWLPRAGNRIRIAFGDPTNVDVVFGRHRAEWRRLVEQQAGDLDSLRDHPKAVQLRIDVAKSARDEVEKLREKMGLPAEEDDTAALAETWAKEPNKRRFKSPVDGSLVNRH
ncbi:monolysocardiolipin acyltransferase [Geosmithia morbida]|uniref:Tafazzin family protein n=1 Tax=Geosmithia morbida TaxID=1094350 RepID=A0A9P4YX50_9HYPO|nr:monolysocardiolipin acyltransferase [Geosmithia morbida]KAF4123298.1 monolysocardiolipin acyltransferase [Geosmithia morbida]